MAKRGETIRRELKQLSVAVKENIFEMLRMACEVLDDHDYCDRFGGQDKVLDSLEKEEFSHFGGAPSLSTMVQAFRKNSSLETWKEYKFNIRAMIELANPREEREVVRIDWKAQAKTLEAELESTKKALADSQSKAESLERDLAEMKVQVGVLERLQNRQNLQPAFAG